MPELDTDTIRHALQIARKHGFRSVRLRAEDSKFRAVLGKAPRKTIEQPSGAVIQLADEEPEFLTICSHLVGYFREGEVPLEVGNEVCRGDVVGVVTALGLANDVESQVEGEIVDVLVEPGQPVEYGQVLAMVKAK